MVLYLGKASLTGTCRKYQGKIRQYAKYELQWPIRRVASFTVSKHNYLSSATYIVSLPSAAHMDEQCFATCNELSQCDNLLECNHR